MLPFADLIAIPLLATEHALPLVAKIQAPPLIAMTQQRYGQMLLARGAPADADRARALLESAVTHAAGIGMQQVVRRCEILQQTLG
jgi:hypothetical protein